MRYRGPTPSPFVGKILRLRKRKLDKSPIGVSPALELPSTLLTTLLGQDLLVEAYKITLSTQFLGELNVGMIRDATRPTERATVDDIDATCESGVLMPDLTHGNRILAIEIKVGTVSRRSNHLLMSHVQPKWGFLPSPSFLAKESAAVKSKYCRFCMQRDLRQSTHLESYCPLDLYSGEEGRMKLALEGLCMSWMESDGGGNNLRFSVDGAVLSPSDVSSASFSNLHPLTSFPAVFVRCSPRAMSESTGIDLHFDGPANYRIVPHVDTPGLSSPLSSAVTPSFSRPGRHRRTRQNILVIHPAILRRVLRIAHRSQISPRSAYRRRMDDFRRTLGTRQIPPTEFASPHRRATPPPSHGVPPLRHI